MSPKLIANMVSRQWWGNLVSASTRNHMWIINGIARYSEALYLESANGAGAIEGEVHDAYVEALTVEQPALIQSGRLEDYSPEFWAAHIRERCGGLNMLRYVVGDKPFQAMLHSIPQDYAWKGISTEDFRKAAEKASGKQLDWFFPRMDRVHWCPRIQDGLHGLSDHQRISRDGQGGPGSRPFPDAGGTPDRDEGNPEDKVVDSVVGTSSEFLVGHFSENLRRLSWIRPIECCG